MTVSGPVRPEDLGVTLHHEHVMSTFGADCARYPEYDLPALTAQVVPYLKKVKSLGCRSLVDCTAAFFGRHPELLRRFSMETGVQILTNTGYYGAAGGRYVPAHAFTESAEQIAARWIHEWLDGIDETGIRPGFIKTGVDGGPLSEIDAKLLRAAALTHRATGLLIQTHTVDNVPAAHEALEILKAEGVSPSAWVWIHAHALSEPGEAVAAARQGAWISFDNLDDRVAGHVLELLSTMRAEGLLGRVLLSHDGDSYCAGDFRPYHFLFSDFTGQLLQNGFTDADIQQLLVDNPRSAYTIEKRLIE
jgi:phosphotriesterase-related protein